MLLQETHSTKKHENLWKYQWHDVIFSHGTSGSRGLCVAFRYNLEYKYKLLSPEMSDKEGRYIILHIEIQGTPCILINYCGPNDETDQVKVLKQLAIHLRNINADQNIICILEGNWNLIFDKSLDAMGGSQSLKYNSLKELQTIILDDNLIDIWRARNPNLRQFTWHREYLLMMRRLDFFLISDDMQYDVNFCKKLTAVQSDHALYFCRSHL